MNQIHFRLNEKEAAIIEQKAAAAEMKPNTYCKQIALNAKIKPPILDKEAAKLLLPQIGRLGANVNQIARSLNMGAETTPEAMEDIKTQLQELLDAIWAMLLDGKKPKKEKEAASIEPDADAAKTQQNVAEETQCSTMEHNEPQEAPPKCHICGKDANKKYSSNRQKEYWICPGYERGNGHLFQWIE